VSSGVEIARTIEDVRAALDKARAKGASVGMVPTMGALHEGHASLIRAARAENDVVVVSIFVNPTQFGPNEDFAKYPRDLETDLRLVEQAGGDVVFNPSAEEMYAGDHSTWVDVEALGAGLCGRSRPGHFKGVCTVVTKLLAIGQPDRAYFGEKDAQQLAIIQRMVRDLNIRTDIVPCPIVREADGLAMSSRNVRLSAKARTQAPLLYKALIAARALVVAGERSAAALERLIRTALVEAPLGEIDYVEIVRVDDLSPVADLEGECLIALAVRFGDVRLIDNVRVSV
jgi:pantoate--beta-alanine ligase